MMLSLIKKDFLLAKKYILIIIILIILLPLLIAERVPDLMGSGPFLLTVLYAELILSQQISMTEFKYPKAAALLCSAPYSRRDIVMAKYIFFLMIFVGCSITYGIMAMIFSDIIVFSVEAVLASFLVITVIYGIFTPCQYKFGIGKTKFAFMIILFAISFGAPTIIKLLPKIDLSILENIPTIIQWAALALVSIIIWNISAMISIKIFSKKEL